MFPDGELVFMVERRSDELAVWMPDFPTKTMTVPIKKGSYLLRVRPFYWSSDMPVEFRCE